MLLSSYADLVDNEKFVGSHVSILWATYLYHKASVSPRFPVLEGKTIINWQIHSLSLPVHMVKANQNLAPTSEWVFSFSVGIRTIISYCLNFLTLAMPGRLQRL